MNIGLLEDNPAILDYMSTALQMAGHNVYTHAQSSSLLDALFAKYGAQDPLPYDLLLVDLLLPDTISGLEAIQYIQQAISFDRLPIIIVSACSQEELEHVGKQLPRVPLLRKPFKMSTLLHLIEEMRVF